MCDASTTSGTASGGWVLSMGDVFGVTSATSPRRTCENNNLEAPSGRCLEISELSVNSPTSCSGFAATPRLYRVPNPVTRQKSSCLSARSTLHRERSTSSSKVSTSGDLRFERKLSKLRNFASIRFPCELHKSLMEPITRNERGSTKFAPSPVLPPSVSLSGIQLAWLSLATRTVSWPGLLRRRTRG